MWDCTVCTFKNKDELFACQMCNFPIGAINPFNRISTNTIQQGSPSPAAGTSAVQSISSNTNYDHDIVMADSDVSFETDDEDYPPISDAQLEIDLDRLRNGRNSAATQGQPLPEGAGYASPPAHCAVAHQKM
ncbi:unnamed protein product [Meganyctiphanes norvegica]|uniref:RanBP2-type domain-containing protein n=1 Tax=Meganyctiphanes norvegica TaxID=48144 RepID=A0AAV2SF72_MEGNR